MEFQVSAMPQALLHLHANRHGQHDLDTDMHVCGLTHWMLFGNTLRCLCTSVERRIVDICAGTLSNLTRSNALALDRHGLSTSF